VGWHPMIIDIMWRFGTNTVTVLSSGAKPALNVQRLPGVGGFVLADAIGKFPGMNRRSLCRDAWDGPPRFTRTSFTARR